MQLLMDDINNDPNTFVVKQSLLHQGYTNEEIDDLFKNTKRKIGLHEAIDLLNEQKQKRLLGIDFQSSSSHQMIVISSDSESSSCSDDEKPPKNNHNASTIIVDSDDDSLSDNDVIMCAHTDLPDDLHLKKWFTATYKPKHDGVVLKKDMFKEFCSHFKVPSYEKLEYLFFGAVDKFLSQIDRYQEVCCIENACFDGLEKVEEEKFLGISETLKKALQIPNKKDASSLSVLPNSTKSKSLIKTEKVSVCSPPISQNHEISVSNRIKNVFSQSTSSSSGSQFVALDKKSQEKVTKTSLKSSYSPTHSSQSANSSDKPVHFNSPKKSTSTPLKVKDSTEKNVHKLTNEQLLNLPENVADSKLRPIVIDGSNVACAHGNGNKYSCRGIALCVRYFWLRGHSEIFCFVPNFRKGPSGNPPPSGQEVLFNLEKKNICKFTPSRKIDGKMVVSYDDRFILDLASQIDGIIVSNDQFRDLIATNKDWKKVIEKQLLPYLFANDIFMPAPDPLGRNGPNLKEFLRLSQPLSPASKKSQTFSIHNKVKHSVYDTGDQANAESSISPETFNDYYYLQPSSSVPSHGKPYVVHGIPSQVYNDPKYTKVKRHEHGKSNEFLVDESRHNSTTANKHNMPRHSVRKQLVDMFPEKEIDIDKLLLLNPEVKDINFLANELLHNDNRYF